MLLVVSTRYNTGYDLTIFITIPNCRAGYESNLRKRQADLVSEVLQSRCMRDDCDRCCRDESGALAMRVTSGCPWGVGRLPGVKPQGPWAPNKLESLLSRPRALCCCMFSWLPTRCSAPGSAVGSDNNCCCPEEASRSW